MFFIPMGMIISPFPALVDLAAPSLLTAQQAAIAAGGGSLPLDAQAAIAHFKAAVPALFTWKNFLINNLLPVTLGNIVGGALMVGSLYWYVYRK